MTHALHLAPYQRLFLLASRRQLAPMPEVQRRAAERARITHLRQNLLNQLDLDRTC